MTDVKNIEVMTRVEGHAKISFILDNKGNIADARFHVIEFKGFEKFMLGRMMYDAPRITTRVCGICPVSHHLASVKACEDLLNVEIPETAKMLRELMHMGQFIHSHALHFFFLGAPDFVLGLDAPPQDRNILGILKANPDLVKKVIRMRKFGQEAIRIIGGKAIHPVTAIPGGMSKGLDKKNQEAMLKEIKELIPMYEEIMYIIQTELRQYTEFVNGFAVLDTNFLSLTNKGSLELYDGMLRATDNECKVIFDTENSNYFKYISERAEPWTYLKFPYLKNIGWPEGVYRVGPLARLNANEKISTPKANKELQNFSRSFGRPANQTLAYHHARLVELLYAMERAEQLLEDSNITGSKINIKMERAAGEGIGIIEAPRGTLIHHYKTNNQGKLIDVNLIVATLNNNAAMNMSVKAAAEGLIKDATISEEGLNKIEMAIRAYDPCLTCAAHSIREMVKSVDFYNESGKLLNRMKF